MRPMTREQVLNRYSKDGRGRGDGAEYRPWLQAHDVPSKGVTFRMSGRKHRREHVFFSTIERDAFLVAQWLDHVVDIREQFPLWPYERTEAIAAELGVNHPTHPKGGVVVMTTDLLITNADGTMTAVAVKPASKLNEMRVLEKLEIERLYWKQQDVSWSIVTERDLPEGLVSNLSWIDDYYDITRETLGPSQIRSIEAHLLSRLKKTGSVALNVICSEADDRLGVEPGTCLGVVRHALARKRWRLPLDQKIVPGEPLRSPPSAAIASGARPIVAA